MSAIYCNVETCSYNLLGECVKEEVTLSSGVCISEKESVSTGGIIEVDHVANENVHTEIVECDERKDQK